MSNGIVLFDFDGTLTITDTLKIQLFLLLLRRPWKILVIISILYKFRKSEINVNKFKEKVFLELLSGRRLNQLTIECYIFKYLYKIISNKNVVNQLFNHLQKKHKVIIATASPAFFIKPIFSKRDIQIIGIDFEINDGRYTGTIKGVIPYHQDKVKKIKKSIGNQEVKYAYTDDTADIPMLNMAEKKFMILKNGTIDEYLPKNI